MLTVAPTDPRFTYRRAVPRARPVTVTRMVGAALALTVVMSVLTRCDTGTSEASGGAIVTTTTTTITATACAAPASRPDSSATSSAEPTDPWQDPFVGGEPGPVPRVASSAPGTRSGLFRGWIQVGGVRRTYLASVPTGARGAPVVIGFHGLGASAAAFGRQSGLCGPTRAAGEILILPDSLGGAFNDGRLGTRGPDDDAFALALIEKFATTGIADPHRVTVTGFSNGAGMAMEVAARHPDRVAAVVSVAGSMLAGADPYQPSGPVRAVLVHGTADRVQPWNGRHRLSRNLPAYLSVPATVEHWVRADGCAHVAASMLAPPAGAPSRGARRMSWHDCTGGVGVTAYSLLGLGHAWPVSSRGSVGRGDELAPVSATALIVRTARTA